MLNMLYCNRKEFVNTRHKSNCFMRGIIMGNVVVYGSDFMHFRLLHLPHVSLTM